jgi:hypothetical protein
MEKARIKYTNVFEFILGKKLYMNISLTFQIFLRNFRKAGSPNVCHKLTTRPCDVFSYPNNISCSYHHIAQDFRQPGGGVFHWLSDFWVTDAIKNK